jgi:GMP reductase
MENIKFDWNDISIVPSETISTVNSRKQVNILHENGKLPIMASPMDTVVDKFNYKKFLDAGLEVCMPRGEKIWDNEDINGFFVSVSLKEFQDIVDYNTDPPQKILVDIANGHMEKLYLLAKQYKEKFPNKELMIGNIAHPNIVKYYQEIKVDYLRIGIGGGSACTTSANGGVHYPMASLIKECYEVRNHYSKGFKTKLVADGGFRTYSDIIKGLALGADYIMLGGVLNKAIECCGSKYMKKIIGDQFSTKEVYEEISQVIAVKNFKTGHSIYTKFRGMSTKEVQKKWGKKELKTSEGISKYNLVEYTLEGWVDNLKDYLKSNMSYCGKEDLKSYIGKVEFVFITQNAFNRFDK